MKTKRNIKKNMGRKTKNNMAKFKIKIGEREKFEKNPFIKYYPKIFDKNFFKEITGDTPGGGDCECNLAFKLGGDGIYISLNNINLEERDQGCISEYVWFFYLYLFRAVQELIKGNEYEYSFDDGPFTLTYKPVNRNYVLITFDWMEDSHYFPKLDDKRDHLKDVSVPFDECIDELYNAANEYIETLLNINPRLSESDELKQLIEARDKAKKAIYKFKYNSKYYIQKLKGILKGIWDEKQKII